MARRRHRVTRRVLILSLAFLAGILASCSDSEPAATDDPTTTTTTQTETTVTTEAPSSEEPPPADDIKIALMLPDLITTRWETIDKPVMLQTVAEICAECELDVLNAESSPETQLSQAQAAIANGVDVVILAPIDKNVAVGIVDQLSEAGVTVISYATIIDSPNVDYGVTTDIPTIGALQAQSLIDGLAARGIDSGGLVVLNGDPSDDFGWRYKEGVHSVLDESPYDIVAEFDATGWDPVEAQSQMDQAITALGTDGFVGVYAANDQLAGGAIASLKGAGIDPTTIPVTGQDGALAGLQRIVAGEQYNTINLPIKTFAARTAELAVSLAKTGEPPAGLVNGERETESGYIIPHYLYDVEVITIDNIGNMISPIGFFDVDEICTADFAAACEAAGLK